MFLDKTVISMYQEHYISTYCELGIKNTGNDTIICCWRNILGNLINWAVCRPILWRLC